MWIYLSLKISITSIKILGHDSIIGISKNYKKWSALPVFLNPVRCRAVSGIPDQCAGRVFDTGSSILADVDEDGFH
jgi:hypothetical protein